MSSKSPILRLHSNKNSIHCGGSSKHGVEHRWSPLRSLCIVQVPTIILISFSDHRNKGWTNGRLVFYSLDLFSLECNNLIVYFLQKGLWPPPFFFMDIFFWEIPFVQNTHKCLKYFLKITHHVEAFEQIKLNGDDSNYVILWEKTNYGDSKKVRGCQKLGEERDE